MKRILLLLFGLIQIFCIAQNKTYIEKSAKSLIANNKSTISNKNSISADQLIGNIISNEDDSEEKIYFVNKKYYLKFNNKVKTLGEYKVIKVNNITLIVLLNESNDYVEGFVLKQNNQQYLVNWDRHSYTDFETYSFTKKASKEKLFLIDEVDVEDFNFYNPNISFDIKNGKIGVSLNGKKFIQNNSDSLSIYGEMLTNFNSGKITLFNLKGKLLLDNLKSVYKYYTTCHQVIDSKNNMYFVDTLGTKLKKPQKYRSLWGNDSNAKRIITYYTFKNKILKTSAELYTENRDKLNKKELNPFDLNQDQYLLNGFKKEMFSLNKKELKSILIKEGLGELIFLEKLLKKDEYLEKIRYYLIADSKSEMIALPKGFKKIKFINGDDKSIDAEDYWYYIAFYKPLKPSYIIVEKSNKYGVWDLEDRKKILPFMYKNITSKNGIYLLLNKDNLFTFYPNIGVTPKYKSLDDYIENYARFEYANGKKGWVDRKGIEYFD